MVFLCFFPRSHRASSRAANWTGDHIQALAAARGLREATGTILSPSRLLFLVLARSVASSASSCTTSATMAGVRLALWIHIKCWFCKEASILRAHPGANSVAEGSTRIPRRRIVASVRRSDLTCRGQASVKLNDGNVMPMFGLGVFKAEPGQSTYSSVLCALKSGYRHIDTAAYYRNEADVGRAIKDSGIPREQIFVTTKLWTGFGGPIDYNGTLAALRESLARLQMAYVDMYLIHSPNDRPNRLQQWRALEAAKARVCLCVCECVCVCVCVCERFLAIPNNSNTHTSFGAWISLSLSLRYAPTRIW